MHLYGLVGAGGFGREVMPLLSCGMLERLHGLQPDAELVFVVEDGIPRGQLCINGHRVLTMTEFLSAPATSRNFNIAIGDSTARERISAALAGKATPFSIQAPNALVLAGNCIGEGAIITSFTHITSNARIGKFFHMNIYSYVAHDCVIGDYVTFAPGVMCNGHVRIEDHAYIGTGAVIKDGTSKPIVIGRGAVIGMGAVVTKSVEPGAIVVGNPAREMPR